MRSTIAPIVLLLTTSLTAQITIGPADMPSAGDTVHYRTTSANGLDATGTEAGYIWDFSMLTPDAEGADTCVTVASTPLLYQLFFNNGISYPQHQASYAQRGRSFGFQALTVNNVYDYFKKDGNGFRNVGFGANVNGLPASVRRTPVDFIHRFPMNFGDMDTCDSEFTLTVPTVLSFTQWQTRYNEVDGWGTLYLPTDTFEVLRVKSTLVRRDSAYVDQFGLGFAFSEPQTIEYKWIAQEMDAPVLLITVVSGQPTTARFHYPPSATGIAPEQAGDASFAAYPNPAREQVSFSIPAGGGLFTLHDAEGRMVYTQRAAPGSPLLHVGIADLAQGTYTATLTGTARTWTSRVVVQR